MKAVNIFVACIAGAAATSLPAKDITTRVKPDGSLSVEARYTVHVGFSGTITNPPGYTNTGMTSAASVNSRGLVEIHNSGGNAGAWGLINNGSTIIGTAAPTGGAGTGDLGTTANTFRGSNPDYMGYRFNLPAKNLTRVDFWNRTYGDGGTFANAPAVQYLDAMENGTWHTIADVTWNPPYNADFLPATQVRGYQITINEAISGQIWGVRIIGDTQSASPSAGTLANDDDGAAIDGRGFIGCQELAVYADLDLGDLDLTNNMALMTNGGMAIASVVHAPFNPDTTPVYPDPAVNVLIDGRMDTRVDTWNGGVSGRDDYLGVMWPSPRYGVGALGVAMTSFGDGGWLDDCTVPLRIEYTTDGTTWVPVTGLQKYRYPQIWQQLWWCASQMAFLFTFDSVQGVTGIRIIGDGNGAADGDGFLGGWELEVFGRPVLAAGFDADSDGDIDADDSVAFGTCMSGPDIPQVDISCQDVDADKDGDVDMSDFGTFQLCFTGPGPAVHWDGNCGP